MHMKIKRLNVMNKIWIVSLFLTLFNSIHAQVIDKIVAQVGEEYINLSDIQKSKLDMVQQGMQVNDMTDCEILEELLYQKLLINQAGIDSLVVSDEAVNNEMEQRIRYFEAQIGGREELEKFYGKPVAKIKQEFFNVIKKRMLAEQMQDKITESMVVTPQDVKDFYNGLHRDSIPYINSKISLAQIVVYPEITEADKVKAKEMLQLYRSQIMNGEKLFETMATLKSDDPGSRLKGGDLGWNSRGTMVPEFEAILFELEPGEISEVFETQYGYHIIKMLERRGDNYHVKHILITAKADDNAFEKAAIKIQEVYTQLKAGTISFNEAALKYSNDESTKQNGGKIVNPYTNDYFWDVQNINDIDPEMYRIVDRMRTGDISKPSLYDNYQEQISGIRIVKLLGKTSPHLANLTDDYQLIYNACVQSKKQEVIDEWINSKITTAYVRIDKEYYSCHFKYNWTKLQ